MYPRLLLVALLVLPACGQKTFANAVTTRSSAGPEETYACVKKQLAELGYKQTSNDVSEYRVSGTKYDYKTRRADVQFRRMVNKLDIDVAAEADGQTGITATGQTFAEYTTHRGPTEEQEKASSEVNADAAQLMERCRSS
jgi:hypothetical protein